MIFIDRMMICPDKVRQFYCKVRQVLQSATIIKKKDRCSSKYANDSRLMNTSCRYIDDNHQYVFRLHCLFFYHYLMVSLLFLNCLTLIFNVLLTYRFTVHGTEKLVFPDIICQRHIHAPDTQNRL